MEKTTGRPFRRPVVIISSPEASSGNNYQVQPVGLVMRASHSACGTGITLATNWPG
jgi:hypothetical protein